MKYILGNKRNLMTDHTLDSMKIVHNILDHCGPGRIKRYLKERKLKMNHICAKDDKKLPIDRPCSACSDGDYKMEYHSHCPPFRETPSQPAEPGATDKLAYELMRHRDWCDVRTQGGLCNCHLDWSEPAVPQATAAEPRILTAADIERIGEEATRDVTCQRCGTGGPILRCGGTRNGCRCACHNAPPPPTRLTDEEIARKAAILCATTISVRQSLYVPKVVVDIIADSIEAAIAEAHRQNDVRIKELEAIIEQLKIELDDAV